MWWTAPPAGSGPVTLYVTAVDGNGGAGTPAVDQDPYDDDVVSASFFVQEAGAHVPTGAQASCAIAPEPARTSWPLALAVAALALALLRLRRRG